MELSLASLCSACFAARALDCVAGGRGVGALPLASARRQSGGWPAAGAAASSSVTHFSPSTRGMPCCYLLRSRASPTRSYIGYTVDPAARLKRHNGIGGAKATRNHRPWEYVCVVSGFTSDTAAKCFEYAWQQPRTPWPQMQERLRIKGLLGATPAYAALRALTKDLHRDSDTVVWNLRVLAAMLGMDKWRSLSVQFAHPADKARARVLPALLPPPSIEGSVVEPLPAAAAARAPAAAPKAAVLSSKRKRDEEIIVVD